MSKRDDRYKDLADCVDDPIRMKRVEDLESILKKTSSWRLRSALSHATEKLQEEARMVEEYLSEKDYVWAADDVLLIVAHLATIKQALLKAGFDPDEEPECDTAWLEVYTGPWGTVKIRDGRLIEGTSPCKSCKHNRTCQTEEKCGKGFDGWELPVFSSSTPPTEPVRYAFKESQLPKEQP